MSTQLRPGILYFFLLSDEVALGLFALISNLLFHTLRVSPGNHILSAAFWGFLRLVRPKGRTQIPEFQTLLSPQLFSLANQSNNSKNNNKNNNKQREDMCRLWCKGAQSGALLLGVQASSTFPGWAKCLEDRQLKAHGSTNQKGKGTHRPTLRSTPEHTWILSHSLHAPEPWLDRSLLLVPKSLTRRKKSPQHSLTTFPKQHRDCTPFPLYLGWVSDKEFL